MQIVHGFADFDILFLVVVNCHSVNLIILKSTASAFLHLVENVGHAVVDVLLRVCKPLCKVGVIGCHFHKVCLNGVLKCSCCVHIDKYLGE